MGDLSINFNRGEFACKCGCGFDTVDFELVIVLEMLRKKFDAPILINSGCRCESYNAKIKGSAKSQHILGRAADIVVAGTSPALVYEFISEMNKNRYGVGKYNTFTHIDTRSGSSARWIDN